MAETRRKSAARKLRRYWRASRPRLVRRWLIDRCETCGRRRRYTEAWHSLGNRDGKVWHRYCLSYEQWHGTAEERLRVLDTITDVWSITQRDVESVVALRTQDDEAGIAIRNETWRVMHALSKHRESSVGAV